MQTSFTCRLQTLERPLSSKIRVFVQLQVALTYLIRQLVRDEAAYASRRREFNLL